MILWPADSEKIIVKLQHCCNVSVFHFILFLVETNFSLQPNWECEPPKDRAPFDPAFIQYSHRG